MPGAGSNERELGGIQQSISDLGRQILDQRKDSDRSRTATALRHDQMFERLSIQDDKIEATRITAEALAEAVRGDREITLVRFKEAEKLTKTRFDAIWRYIAPAGAGGMVLGGGALVWKMLAG